jgi:hypothetical protein
VKYPGKHPGTGGKNLSRKARLPTQNAQAFYSTHCQTKLFG